MAKQSTLSLASLEDARRLDAIIAMADSGDPDARKKLDELFNQITWPEKCLADQSNSLLESK